MNKPTVFSKKFIMFRVYSLFYFLKVNLGLDSNTSEINIFQQYFIEGSR